MVEGTLEGLLSGVGYGGDDLREARTISGSTRPLAGPEASEASSQLR